MATITFNLSKTAGSPGWDPSRPDHDALWDAFATGYSYSIVGGSGQIFDSSRGSDPATRQTTDTFNSAAGSIDLTANNFSGNVSLDWLDSGDTARLRLDSAWNTIKDAYVGDFSGHKLILENWVDAWVTLDNDFGQEVRVDGAKRGEIVTGSGDDTVWVGADSNGADWTNSFRIATGDGNDHIIMTVSTRDYSGASFAAVYKAEWTTSIIDAGAGNDLIEGGGGKDTVDGGSGLDTFVLHGARAFYDVSTVNGVTTIRDLRSGAANQDGTDIVRHVESLQFADQTLVIDKPPVLDADKVLAIAEDATTPLGIAVPVDPEGASLTITVTALPSAAKGLLLMADGVTPVTVGQSLSAGELASLQFDPASHVSGAAGAFSYSVSDGTYVRTGTVNLTITPATPPGDGDDPIQVTDDAYSTDAHIVLIVDAAHGLLSNDFSPDGGLKIYDPARSPDAPLSQPYVIDQASGTLSINADGSFSFKAKPGYFYGDGPVSFTYYVADADNSSGIRYSGAVQFTVTQQGNSVVDLAHLAAADGFAIAGAVGGGIGANVSRAGDVNHDGFGDLLLGAPDAGSGNGAAYIVYGHASGDVDLQNPGVKASPLTGSAGEHFGSGVAYVGDFNGDGFGDLLIGNDVDGGADTAYVVLGTAEGFGSSPLAIASDDAVYKIALGSPLSSNDQFRVPLSAPGDINGDGLDDVLLTIQKTGNWPSYLVDGTHGAGGSTPLTDFSLVEYTRAAGDVNGDGFDDLVLFNRTGSGGGVKNEFDVLLGGSNPTLNPADALYRFGFGNMTVNDLGTAGDFNGDGLDDIVVAFRPAASGPQVVAEIVLSGNTTAPLATATTITSSSGSLTGYHAVSVGDVNHDGFGDIALTRQGSSDAWVIFGRESSAASISLEDIAAGHGGFEITGPSAGTGFLQIAAAGDVNGDGVDDLLIGNSQNNTAHVLFGHSDWLV